MIRYLTLEETTNDKNVLRKSEYLNKSGERIYILENIEYKENNEYKNDIWNFKNDFDIEKAKYFIKDYKKEYVKSGI